jgi:hypothetical protein
VTGSILVSLLVVGVTALIFDEVIARQKRRERDLVTVRGKILYAQARRAFGAVARGDEASGPSRALEEIRPLASLLLAAADYIWASSHVERRPRLSGWSAWVGALSSRTGLC